MTPKQRRDKAGKASAVHATAIAEIKKLQGRLGATEARRKEASDAAARLDRDAIEAKRRELAIDELAHTAIQALNNPMIPLRVREMTVDGLQMHLNRLRAERARIATGEQQATDPGNRKGRPL